LREPAWVKLPAVLQFHFASLLEFGARVWRDQRRLKPRDMIDVQSFIWVQGSDEYN